MQLLGIGHGLGGGADIGLGHDFQQRRAGAVQVDAGLADELVVHGLAGVFLQVGTHQAHGLEDVVLAFFQIEADFTALHHGDLELGDLVALGQVGVEVVLAREDGTRRNRRAQRQAELDGAFHGLFVHHRQRAGQGQVHGAGLGVGLGAEGGAGTAEDLAVGRQLGVGLEADDDFVAID
ncbi:hypothetical protein SDC9_129527 [bioreactor metagenome]|uniref:NAD-specific glutamate dehydrogenase n=1 Tax=bioreactor metagenome TaxID=1076179 RepID=A0A645CZ84_9ZZZZ